MAICERCGKEHDGSYGSGRFCSKYCANKRVISDKQKEYISKLTKQRLKKNYIPKLETRTCLKCGKEFTVDVRKENKRKPKKFCSRSCANGHTITEKQKEKTSKSMKAFFQTKQGQIVKTQIGKKLKQAYVDNPDLRIKRAKEAMRGRYKIKNYSKVLFTCPVCGKQLELTPSEAKKRKYCSGHCRNIINNQKVNGTRSKAELMLENFLKTKYPQIKFEICNRKILEGLELDIYFPDIQFAIEWNGVFHYKDVGHNLKQIQQRDEQKRIICKQKNIDLYVIKDLTSSKKFVEKEIMKIESILKDKYHL